MTVHERAYLRKCRYISSQVIISQDLFQTEILQAQSPLRRFHLMETTSKAALARKTHVVLFTSLGLGHIIPFAELARSLAKDHACKVTFITFPWEPDSRQESILTNLISPELDIRLLPLDTFDMGDIINDKSLRIEAVISAMKERAKPYFEKALRSIKDHVDGLIVDFFCTAMIDVAASLGIPPYLFMTSGMPLLTLMFSLPKYDELHPVSLKDVDVILDIEGLPPLRSLTDIPHVFLDRTDLGFKYCLNHARRFQEFKAIFVNTFEDLEHRPMHALRTAKSDLLPERVPPLYAVGPIIAKDAKSTSERQACLEWLDSQPEKSVVFVSFGSGATFSKEQIREIALGLKESGHRFLWVVRRPLSDDSSSTYLKMTDTVVEELLPPGFLEDTKERGMVVPSWAPQMEILGHRSTGGFVCHCGWNSILETIWNGVPVVTWPVFADQWLNKEIVVQEMKIGIRVAMGKDDFVKKEEVARSVRELMEGEEGKKARENAKQLMDKTRASVAPGGASDRAWAEGLVMLRRDPCET